VLSVLTLMTVVVVVSDSTEVEDVVVMTVVVSVNGVVVGLIRVTVLLK
jgi:hypothetical protein